ncbi:MAG: hypothetical protein N2167_02785 [Flavobacteriales bacterium]|nr:hypothetical protein [Flavobacteriales bacterium]
MFLIQIDIFSKVRYLLYLIFFFSNNLNAQKTCWCYEYRYETTDTFKLLVVDTSFFETPFKIKAQYKYIYDDPYIIILPAKLDNGKFFDISLPMHINVKPADTMVYDMNSHTFYIKSSNSFVKTCIDNKPLDLSLIKSNKKNVVKLINSVTIENKSNIPESCLIPELAIYKIKGMGQITAYNSFKKAKLVRYSICSCLDASLKSKLKDIFNSLAKQAQIKCFPNSFMHYQPMFDFSKTQKIEDP